MSVLVLGHKNPDTDSIVAAISYAYVLNKRGIEALAVAQGEAAPETAFVLKKFNLAAPEVVTSVADKDTYLVDFSDLAQAPNDFAKARLLGIVDHHKLGDVTSDTPLECWIQPYGCSNTIVKMVADYYNVSIPADIAGAMLCAILSDTVLFKSPTCTQFDKDAANALAKIAGCRLCSYMKKQYGDNFISAIPANAYGLNDCFDPERSHVIPALIMKYHNAKMNGTPSIDLWGTGKARREFIYTDDLADGCIFLMNNYDGNET
ncbi:MAG: NAD-dependent epimerase/dehydratase family protein, partial [Succinivibrio sp.]